MQQDLPVKPASVIKAFIALMAGLFVVWLAFQSYYVVSPGHVAVATIFGKVKPNAYDAGMHFPVNPLFDWTVFDARQKTWMESANVPSQDQLQTKIDVSIQYRISGEAAPRILAETGTANDALTVHLVPKLRSVLREQGKSIKRAEDFFLEETQANLQTALQGELRTFLEPKGILVEAVLIRDITLPPFIMKAIEQKKEREQAVEKQKAELERFRFEQDQIVAEADARRKAAEQEAKQREVLADAQAYEIRKINEAISNNPTYVQLQALEALKEMSKDPAAKIYFIDSSAQMPVPLMHMGDRR